MHKRVTTGHNGQEKQQIKALRAQLRAMGRLLRLLPLSIFDRPAGARSAWPNFHQQSWGMMSSKRTPIRPKLTPEQVTWVEDWLTHLMRLQTDERRIVLARATGIPGRKLEDMDGRSHTTLRKVEEAGLRRLLQQNLPAIGDTIPFSP